MANRKVLYLQISFLIVCYFVEFLLLCIKQQGFFFVPTSIVYLNNVLLFFKMSYR
jgi:hypothetical protein